MLNPHQIDALGWTLIHFLWQGAVLAILLYLLAAFTNSPKIRYAAAVLTLLGMACAPLITFFVLSARHPEVVSPSKLQIMLNNLETVASAGAGIPVLSATRSLSAVDWINYLVCIWLIGVVVFSLRALGGYLVLRRLLRERCNPLSAALEERCHELQRKLGLKTAIRYCQSRMVSVPSVVGWFRPVVLVPVSALSGLSPLQLEAVLLHEMAHIQRFDCFVNLLQIAIEAVLFYHPATWWVSRTIRQEREKCCDDVAVAVSGDAGQYAHALALMASSRPAPVFAMAATNGALKNRVGRILGLEAMGRAVPQGGLALFACLCVAGVVLGASTFSNSVQSAEASTASTSESAIAQTPPAPPAVAVAPARPAQTRGFKADPPSVPDAVPRPAAVPAAPAIDPEQDTKTSGAGGSSYLDGLKAAGLNNLNVDQLIAMKVQGITPEYIHAMRAAGVDVSPDQLIALKVQGVTADYIRHVRATGSKDATINQILAMKVQGVDPSQADRYRQELGLKEMSLDQLIAFKVQGVTPDYVRSLQSAGFKDLSSDQIIGAKVQGITPEFVQKVRDHGFANLSLHQLIALKNAGVF